MVRRSKLGTGCERSAASADSASRGNTAARWSAWLPGLGVRRSRHPLADLGRSLVEALGELALTAVTLDQAGEVGEANVIDWEHVYSR